MWVVCEECDGEGVVKVGTTEVECPLCAGKGTVKEVVESVAKFYTYKDTSRK